MMCYLRFEDLHRVKEDPCAVDKEGDSDRRLCLGAVKNIFGTALLVF